MSSYISSLLRNHFGKGPSSVHVVIRPPFITLNIHGFLSPMEKALEKNKNSQKVIEETRQLVMKELKVAIKQHFHEEFGIELNELYVDWHLKTRTGLIWGVMEEEVRKNPFGWPNDVNKKAFHKRSNEAHSRAVKIPAHTESYWLDNRTILVRRSGILTGIEKSLVKNGLTKELRIARRPLEYKAFSEAGVESVLKRKIRDVFLDWNFETDMGYLVCILEPQTP
ncbi:DUF2294 family protein [Planomicrobium chinense]|nr:DUF2294 family protein [Planococcus chinensis]